MLQKLWFSNLDAHETLGNIKNTDAGSLLKDKYLIMYEIRYHHQVLKNLPDDYNM